MHTLIAMFCVALALVFASASAAGVADRVEHTLGGQHEHGLHLGVSLSDDHHQSEPGHANENEPGAGDQGPTPGHHHHADAPTGALSLAGEVAPVIIQTGIVGSLVQVVEAGGVRPGGLERPPKRMAKLV